MSSEQKDYSHLELAVVKALNRSLGRIEDRVLDREGKEQDLEDALNYNKFPIFRDYYEMFEKNPLASGLVLKFVTTTFRGGFKLVNGKNTDPTEFEDAWEKLNEEFKLMSILQRADTLCMLGHYGGMFMGLSDVYTVQDLLSPVTGKNLELLYIRPLGEGHMDLSLFDDNLRSARYGLPKDYRIKMFDLPTTAATVQNAQQGTLHLSANHTRVVHVAYDKLENILYGIPFLKPVYNKLTDVDLKIVGGSGEMFWRGARPGYHAKLDPLFHGTTDLEKQLQSHVEEFERNLKRVLITEGIDIDSLSTQVSSPKDHFWVQLASICAAKRIPLSIFIGGQTIERANVQDRLDWFGTIGERRMEVESELVRPMVDMFIMYGILPDPGKDGYTVAWGDLNVVSDKEKFEVSKLKSEIIKNYCTEFSTMELFPLKLFAKSILHLTPQEIEELDYDSVQKIIEEQIIISGHKGQEDGGSGGQE